MSRDLKFLIIIGCPKARTTSAANWLGSRPDMALGIEKEPRYFTDFDAPVWGWQGPAISGFLRSLVTTEATYFANFPHKPDAEWAVDGYTGYLWRSEVSAPMIKAFSERFETKLVCLTRDPVSRAISEYNHTLSAEMENLSFRASLDAEAERTRAGYHPLFRHIRRSQIATDIERFSDLFGDDLLLLDQDELKDPESFNTRISTFLSIPLEPFKDRGIHNRRELPRNRAAEWLLGAEGVKAAARRVVPKAVRHTLWKSLHKSSAELPTVSDDEIAYARDLLADEIARCEASPLADQHLNMERCARLTPPPRSAQEFENAGLRAASISATARLRPTRSARRW